MSPPSYRRHASYYIAYILIFLSILTPLSAQEIYQHKGLAADFSIAGSIGTDGGGSADNIRIKLPFILESNAYQEIGSRESLYTDYMEKEGITEFDIKELHGSKNFGIRYQISTEQNFPKLRKKIRFPFDINESLKEFTKSTETIDASDASIRRKAEEIASGRDDALDVIFAVTSWVADNIDYDLSTLNVEATQKASYVLEHRNGVCDELSVLSIAMLRSLGIPARFVAGVSYTEEDYFKNNWVAHGWIEAYIPSEGWIPFDPTFKELGYTDSTHIKFFDSADKTSITTHYEWTGSAKSLNISELLFQGDIISKGELIKNDLSIDITPLKKELAFGSYQVMIINVANDEDFYIPLHLRISAPKEIGIKNRDIYLLNRPKSRISLPVKLSISDELSKEYSYTFPFVVQYPGGSKNTSFTSSIRGEYLSEKYVDDLISQSSEKNGKSVDKYPGDKISVDCTVDKELFIGEESEVVCKIKNMGNYRRNIDFCINRCEKISLGISREKEFKDKIIADSPGEKELQYTIEGDISLKGRLTYNVQDRPNMTLSLDYPKKVGYGDTVDIIGVTDIKSTYTPIDPTLTFFIPDDEVQFKVDNKRRSVSDLKIRYSHLRYGKNKIRVMLEWKDSSGKKYHKEEYAEIELKEDSLFRKILLRIMTLFN